MRHMQAYQWLNKFMQYIVLADVKQSEKYLSSSP